MPVQIAASTSRASVGAWVPADRLSRPSYVPANPLPRIALPDEQADWPGPVQVDVDYYLGCWRDGEFGHAGRSHD